MDSNRELVEYLERGNWLRTDRVKKAFLKTDRKVFAPENLKDKSYEDAPIPLNSGSTVSAPHIVAKITELAEVEDDSEVLEVGSGSGYQLSILSFLSDHVTGMEPVRELVEQSRKALSDRENVEILQGNAPEDVEGRYDRIIVSYAADPESWNRLKIYLNEDGILVGAVSSDGTQHLRKYRNGSEEVLDRVRFVRSR